jgi:hypothetical protein
MPPAKQKGGKFGNEDLFSLRLGAFAKYSGRFNAFPLPLARLARVSGPLALLAPV